MKKRSTIALSLCSVLFLASCNDENKEADPGLEIGRLQLSDAKPQPGDQIRVQYQKDTEDSAMPEATVDYIVNKSFYPEDLELKDSADFWVGRIQIPDSTMAMAFNFMNDLKYENNNKKGYIIPTLFRRRR